MEWEHKLLYHPTLANCGASSLHKKEVCVPTPCTSDSDCDTENCFYCLSSGSCGQYDSEYCDTNECGIGDGDCDLGTCPSGMTCGYNNFLDYHPSLANCGASSLHKKEVCVPTPCTSDSDCDTENCFYCLSNGSCGQYDSEYCDTNECGIGDGDCDLGTCLSETTCGSNNFLDYHPSLANCGAPSLQYKEVLVVSSMFPRSRVPTV